MSGPITGVASADPGGVAGSDVALPAKVPAEVARPILRTLAGWLSDPSPGHVADDTSSWREAEWSVARRLISIHGLAAHLVAGGLASAAGSALPADLVAWLTEQDAQNAARIQRIHGELAALLAAASRERIEVMPLKGALLTTMPAMRGYRRPMSDIDILVRPSDREAAARLLVRLGYERIDEANPRPTHDVFLPPGSRVVSIDEHADNPRRVELHTEVVRHLWGWFRTDELTAALWERATSQIVLDEPAMVPHVDDLLCHLAVHASSDLLADRGRLVQWLDIARLATSGARLGRPAHELVAFISLRLTERAIPGSIPVGDLAALEVRMPHGLVSTVGSAPLDDRSGLFVDYVRASPASASERWQRWRPTRRRLWAAYGDDPLPVGLLRHARRLAAVATQRGG